VPLSRRGVLIAMIGATAVFGFSRAAKAAMDPATPTCAPPAAVSPLFKPTIGFSIDAGGLVTVNILDNPSDTVPGWVMVIAESYLTAIRAADLVKVDCTPGLTATVSEKDIQNHAAQLIPSRTLGRCSTPGTMTRRPAFAPLSQDWNRPTPRQACYIFSLNQ
jgi:isoquinoline 1-oxidoreductase subunit beta